MNAVEIEAALSDLALEPFDAGEFPFAFLAAFGNKDVTLKRLRNGNNNASDVTGGVLQRNNIHIAACSEGAVGTTLRALKDSPATAKAKARFILATDGHTLEAEELATGETIACDYPDFPNHFGFLLPLAGISTVKEIKENPIDIRATGRLNKLYVELLRENPDWATEARRHDMNHFMARLVFCFFAEDTEIFPDAGMFTKTVEGMSERDGSNTHLVLSEIFRALNIKYDVRAAVQPKLPNWTNRFPYVNGGLFAGNTDVPRFSRMARTYFMHAGTLDWQAINPDIFGSMIQAVADDEERGALGMHYTSVPNILKVLNPLFLDELRAQLEEAGDNQRKLLNLRKRIARIRVFDPACGSGNFLVIAYKQLRELESLVNQRRGETHLRSEIPLTNFRGIELRGFAAEIARLALIIAEFQCDVLYRGQQDAIREFLPLDADNWIVCGNALRLDWLSVCPATGRSAQIVADDLFETPLDTVEIDIANEGGETYICGNPPYRGSKWQTDDQKADMLNAWSKYPKLAKNTDFVSGWISKFLDYADRVPDVVAAFVSTNSICQGQQATEIWPVVFERGCEILFAHTSFRWANLATRNAGVTVVVIGLSKTSSLPKRIFQDDLVRRCEMIGPYLVPDSLVSVQKCNKPIGEQSVMFFGNMPRDGGNLLLGKDMAAEVLAKDEIARPFIRQFIGSEELIGGRLRYCLWIPEVAKADAAQSKFIADRLTLVSKNRSESTAASTRDFSGKPHRFVQIAGYAERSAIVVPRVSSESRQFLPVDFFDQQRIAADSTFALYDAPLWNMALIASRLHLVWIATVCGKLKTDFRYSNTLGWNTFPVPKLTQQNKTDLTHCAEQILLAREAHFPATIADLYDPENMPDDLRLAHEQNDEVLERIYIGRRFKNDTERLEKLFELYTKMVEAEGKAGGRSKAKSEANAS